MVEGFKNTELGLRPADWLPTPISNFITEFRGGAPLKPSDFTKIGFNILPKVGVIRGGNLFIEMEKQQYCNDAYAYSHKSNIVDNSFTIVVLRDLVPSGPNIGLMVRINTNDKYLLAQGVYGFKVEGIVSPDFLIHVSNTVEYRKVMRNIMVGSTQVHITNGNFKQILIPIPPTKAEQTAIATALNDADALINQLEQLLTKKRNIKTGAMQELLKPKEGWEEKTLGEIAIVRDGTHQTPKYTEQGVPFYSVENVTANDFINTKFISSKEHAFLTKNWKIEKGDILMTRIGSIGVCKYVDWEVDASFYVSLALLKINKENSARFICHYSKFEYFKKEVELNSLQFAYPQKINLGQISKVKLIIPKSIDEQTCIAQILTDMDTEIQELERKIEKYKMLKQGMMQSLLTGKIRLV